VNVREKQATLLRLLSPKPLRAWVPPRLLEMYAYLIGDQIGLTALFPDWEAARSNAGRYSDEAITERMVAAAQAAFASKGTKFERDGAVFDQPVTPYHLAACLLRIAMANDGRLAIADFGGGLGSSFFQCRQFLSCLNELQWYVVEQPALVRRGRELFEGEELHFRDTLLDISAAAQPQVVLFSGVLQYLDDPYGVLAEAVALNPRAIIVDRNPESDNLEDAFSVQALPRYLGSRRIPCRVFGARSIESALPGYSRAFDFSTIDPDMHADGLLVKMRGSLYEKLK
jgi:putative methyltransferase (TIGR04325 family)